MPRVERWRTTGTRCSAETVFVLHHGVADAGLVGKIFSRVGEERGESLLAFEGFDEGFYRLRENRILRPGGDDFIGVAGKNGENFRAFRGSKMCTAGANGDFSFARGAAAAQIFENFGAERFHTGLWPQVLVSKHHCTGGAGRAERRHGLAVQFPATPRKSPPAVTSNCRLAEK